MKKKNRVYGIIGIKSIMANWNADFTGRPKTTINGNIFGSDKANKYPMKKMWMDNGEKVLYIKSYKMDGKDRKLQPKDLGERYEEIFEKKLDKKATSEEVLKDLFSAIDVMNFGATFAEKGQNLSITGAIQMGQGLNKYADTVVEIQDILSPFRNANKKEADASSLGSKIILDEAHYFYSFSVNPDNYNNYINLIEEFEGYTEEAYEKFKEASLVAATALDTNSKFGSENEFSMFIECRDSSKLYLADLSQYVKFYKEDDESIIDLKELEFLNEENFKKEIKNIEIYYNPYKVKVKGNIKNSKSMNIFTREVI